jgi:hypothetical protein
MSVLLRLKRTFREVRNGKPGRRFIDHHDRTRRSESGNETAWRNVAHIAGGVVLLAAGLLLSLPPGVPGFLLWIPGLALLASRLRWLAMLLDYAEVLGRRVIGRFRRRR